MEIRPFFDPSTFTVSYVAYEPHFRDAVIIDPVLDFDRLTWRTAPSSVSELESFIRAKDLRVRWILDTHAHADHLSGMEVLRERFGAPTAIGEDITAVQRLFAQVFNLYIKTDGSQWDELLSEGQILQAGSFEIEVLHTPGHTPACLTFKIGDAIFTGDALFMPDYGTGRCDFPRGSAADLYDSVHEKLYSLPDATRVFVGHDYQPGGREPQWETTIGESKERNIQLRASTSRSDFIEFREKRDATLDPPHLILQSLQVNIAAGRLPEPEENEQRYLKMPIGFLGS